MQGWVEAEIVYVSPDEQGRVETLKVREGDKVAQGDLLFTLDDDLQKADLVVKQAAVTTAQQAFDRAQDLLRAAAGTQKALDDAEAALRQAKANLGWSETRLARRRGLSPAGGTIQQVYYRPGETVPAGPAGDRAAAARAISSCASSRRRRCCRASRSARRVAVSCDGCAKGMTAKVSFIARSAEYTPPVIYSLEERAKLVYLIEARPADPEKLRVGQPVTVTLPEPPK